MVNRTEMEPDLTVRSQNSNDSRNSDESKNSKESKPDSSAESKHSKEVLISEKQRHTEVKDDSNLFMFTSCAQLLLGVVLVTFSVLVLLHGASLGGTGAGLWAGIAALAAGALGIVATLTTPEDKSIPSNSSFSTAHLASSLIALAVANMATITALTAVVRDYQRTQESPLPNDSSEDDSVMGVDPRWAGLLASIGLLVASIAELLVSGYVCVKLAPRLCDCLKSSSAKTNQGHLKTHNMVDQWVSSHPKSQPIYLIQPMVPVQPMLQAPYAIAAMPKKYPGLIPATGTFAPPSMYHSMPSSYKMPRGQHCPPNPRYNPQMVRIKRKRYGVPEHGAMSLPNQRSKLEAVAASQTIPRKNKSSHADVEPVDLAQTYTGLDKKMSEEFISIAMDPDKKSKASSGNGSELSSALRKPSETSTEARL